MSLRSTTTKSRKRFATGLVAGIAVISLAACTSNDSGDDDDDDSAAAPRRLRPGRTTRPATRSSSASPPPPPTTAGWARSPSPPRTEAAKYDDVELRVAEGTNDVAVQISQVETFINDGSTRSCCCRSTAPR